MSVNQQDLVVTLCGCGFMGTALLSGILDATRNSESRVKKYIATVQKPDSASRLEKTFAGDNVEVIRGNNAQAIKEADVVVLGFQPGDVQSILGHEETANALRGKLIVSMLAGISCETIVKTLRSACTADSGNAWVVVRAVPSIGAQIRESMTLFSESELNADQVAIVEWLFGQVGSTVTVPEKSVDSAVAISASCHALVVTALDAVLDGSVSRGTPRSTALKIAAQCLRGASSLLLQKMTIEELKDAMSVPRGITTEAWIELDAGNVRPAVSQTIRKAVDYAENMG